MDVCYCELVYMQRAQEKKYDMSGRITIGTHYSLYALHSLVALFAMNIKKHNRGYYIRVDTVLECPGMSWNVLEKATVLEKSWNFG